jgi:LmbE family N-acetylglucosaminyl deacetylase
MQPDKGKRVLTHIFFSPHLDDAVLSCGGLMASLNSQGAVIKMVTAFGGVPAESGLSPFARHLHAKWGLADAAAVSTRRQEDRQACEILEVPCVHWDFLEAIYRRDEQGQPCYPSYESLNNPRLEEGALRQAVGEALRDALAAYPEEQTRLYFPLGLARHVDHQLLADLGRELAAAGRDVWFYEEWPYLENLEAPPSPPQGWAARWMPIDTSAKIEAAVRYTSQMGGLGGEPSALGKRLRASAAREGRARSGERYWHPTHCEVLERLPRFSQPARQWRWGGFEPVLRTTKDFASVRDYLPPGRGVLLDVGCGDGRYRELAETRGFDWQGFDVFPHRTPTVRCNFQADASRIPLADGTAEAVLAWCVLAYLPDPAQALAEMRRVLRTGGALVGMVSFLEPVHGITYSGLSPAGIRHWLESLGFEDVRILPGLNGFTLMLWTWLRRYGGKWAAGLAFPLTRLWLVPLVGSKFLVSWIRWRFFGGSGYGMHWVAEQMPLDFAGHLIFTARKGLRGGKDPG